MKVRNRLCRAALKAVLFTMCAAPIAALAQDWPSRSVTIVVPLGAGTASDVAARVVMEQVGKQLGQTFVIENRPGAGTNIGVEAVVRAAPDGYTLLITTPASTINATLYDKLSFNFVRDIAPIAAVVRTPFVMAINPAVPANTVAEFIAYGKANPGKLSMASSGIGSSPHATGELFKMMAGVDMVHVPYRGAGPALTDLIAGQVHVYFTALPEAIEHIRTGRLRALAVTTLSRADVLPQVPTLSEVLPGFESSFWVGFGAPKQTPAEIVDRLNSEINAALADPKIKSRLTDLGGTVLGGTGADFGRLIADETEKWGKVVKFAGMKPG
jgi:tripartite-type tricarboxylate transporter receptor subunit TctC